MSAWHRRARRSLRRRAQGVGRPERGLHRCVVAERLALDFAAGPDDVGAVVAKAYARTEGARVQSFRVLLAERDARTALRQTLETGAAPRLRATA